MNRLFARFFAMMVGTIHLLVIAGLSVAVLAEVGGQPFATQVRASAGQIPETMPTLAAVALAFIGCVLFMGVVSALMSITANLERLVHRVDPALSPRS